MKQRNEKLFLGRLIRAYKITGGIPSNFFEVGEKGLIESFAKQNKYSFRELFINLASVFYTYSLK